jgi:hypothetical protein
VFLSQLSESMGLAHFEVSSVDGAVLHCVHARSVSFAVLVELSAISVSVLILHALHLVEPLQQLVVRRGHLARKHVAGADLLFVVFGEPARASGATPTVPRLQTPHTASAAQHKNTNEKKKQTNAKQRTCVACRPHLPKNRPRDAVRQSTDAAKTKYMSTYKIIQYISIYIIQTIQYKISKKNNSNTTLQLPQKKKSGHLEKLCAAGSFLGVAREALFQKVCQLARHARRQQRMRVFHHLPRKKHHQTTLQTKQMNKAKTLNMADMGGRS